MIIQTLYHNTPMNTTSHTHPLYLSIGDGCMPYFIGGQLGQRDQEMGRRQLSYLCSQRHGAEEGHQIVRDTSWQGGVDNLV